MHVLGHHQRILKLAGLCFAWLLFAAIAAEATPNPVVRYLLDGNATDASGNELHGTAIGAEPTADACARSRGAMSFNGVGGRIEVPDHALLDISESVTIALWARWDPAPQGIFLCKRALGGPMNYCLLAGETLTGLHTVAFTYGVGPDNSICSVALELGDGEWHHLAFSYAYGDSASATWMVDGQLMPRVWTRGNLTPGGGTDPATPNDGPLMLGGQLSPSPGYLYGDLDDVHIYNTYMSVEGLRSLYRPNCAGSILVYSTRGDGGNLSRRDFDTDLEQILDQDGYYVRTEDRASLPILDSDILAGFDQLWFVSTETDPVLSTDEVDAIRRFHRSGKSLFVIGDSFSYDGPANQISAEWGVTFSLQVDQCGGTIGCCLPTSGFVGHPIWSAVPTIQGNQNEGHLMATAPAQVIAFSGENNLVAVRDVPGEGRLAWDSTVYRIMDVTGHPDLSVRHCGNEIYVRNMANWLAGRRYILVYTTRGVGTGVGVRRWDYDEDLPGILGAMNFRVITEDRESVPVLTSQYLRDYDQLWFVSTETAGVLAPEEVQAIRDFHSAGRAILVIGDSDAYDGPANQISEEWGVTYDSELSRCSTGIGCCIDAAASGQTHIWNQVGSIQGNINEGALSVTAPAEAIVSYGGRDMIAIRDAIDGGRIAWETTYYRFTDASAHPDLSILACDNAQYVLNLLQWLAGGSLTSAPEPIPEQFAIEHCAYPNPFNPRTIISYSLPSPSRVSLLVYDVAGRLVNVLKREEMTPAGYHTVEWAGNNAHGQLVPSGVYFYRLETAYGVVTGKMVAIK